MKRNILILLSLIFIVLCVIVTGCTSTLNSSSGNSSKNIAPPTFNGSWTQMTANAGWSPREGQCSVVMPDGSIVLMGGLSGSGDGELHNDVWRSIDNGATWTEITANAGWSPRAGQSSVVMPDGSIVLMAGRMGYDVWRSTDNGTTWTQMTANAGWPPRQSPSCVVMPDSSIILMGGAKGLGGMDSLNDVWRSTNNGATWTEMTANAGWSPRAGQSSVVMPDGSIVLMGGNGGGIGYKPGAPFLDDVWRSTDEGATWTQQTLNHGWTDREDFSSVALPDGSIVLMGGYDFDGGDYHLKNDVWRFMR